VGDQIWIFDAAKVPFVLRPCDSGDTFDLIGEAYVHGPINGEIFEHHLCGEYKDTTFGMKSSLATVAPGGTLYA
jgi:hypothetical protein